MTPDATGPDMIVLIHGLWVTPRSWEHWITHYEAKGYKVLAPAYPGFEMEVEALLRLHQHVPGGRGRRDLRALRDPGAGRRCCSSPPRRTTSCPPKVQQSNARHYKSDTVTEVKQYAGYSHLLPAQEGWEGIADDLLEWAVANAR